MQYPKNISFYKAMLITFVVSFKKCSCFKRRSFWLFLTAEAIPFILSSAPPRFEPVRRYQVIYVKVKIIFSNYAFMVEPIGEACMAV